jgi:DNA repair protein RecN (Recombination protein N)
LREERKRAARVLEAAVGKELGSLAMKGTQFQVALSPGEPAAHGMDSVEFMVSANPGEPPRPLDRVASGGELSRIALALKTVLAAQPSPDESRTLVFDEVDAGVGGAAAEAVGRRLKRISQHHQVLCVTHLAQIAGFANQHFVISKREAGGRAVIEAKELSGEERVAEIARMLSGARLSEEALRHAEKLMASYSGPRT